MNEPASHGFVSFRIDLVEGLPIGTRINNSAAIYFDRNDPIFTDTAWHVIGTDIYGSIGLGRDKVEPVKVALYPNPQHAGNGVEFMLEGPWSGNGSISVWSDLGVKLWVLPTEVHPGLNHWRLDMGYLPAGMYRVVLSLESGEKVVRTLLIH